MVAARVGPIDGCVIRLCSVRKPYAGVCGPCAEDIVVISLRLHTGAAVSLNAYLGAMGNNGEPAGSSACRNLPHTSADCRCGPRYSATAEAVHCLGQGEKRDPRLPQPQAPSRDGDDRVGGADEPRPAHDKPSGAEAWPGPGGACASIHGARRRHVRPQGSPALSWGPSGPDDAGAAAADDDDVGDRW